MNRDGTEFPLVGLGGRILVCVFPGILGALSARLGVGLADLDIIATGRPASGLREELAKLEYGNLTERKLPIRLPRTPPPKMAIGRLR